MPKGIALVKCRITCGGAITPFLGWLDCTILWNSGKVKHSTLLIVT